MISFDNLSNFFAGDVRYGNYDINSPSSNFLVGEKITDFVNLITNLFEVSDIGIVEEIITQEDLNSWSDFSIKSLLKFKLASTNIYSLKRAIMSGNSQLSLGNFSYNAISLKPNEPEIEVAKIQKIYDFSIASVNSNINWLATISEDSFALLLFESKVGGNNMEFFYAGRTNITNPLNDYYTASPVSNAVLLHSYTEIGGFPQVNTKHFVGNSEKSLLQTGPAVYPVSCGNGQWATDMIIFDNSPGFNFPAVGRLPNLLLATGVYEYLKPIKLITAPDTGSNVWIPVGTYASKTLLMRSYSSL